MRKITIADAIKDRKASTRATTREIMFFKLIVSYSSLLQESVKFVDMREDVWSSLDVTGIDNSSTLLRNDE